VARITGERDRVQQKRASKNGAVPHVRGDESSHATDTYSGGNEGAQDVQARVQHGAERDAGVHGVRHLLVLRGAQGVHALQRGLRVHVRLARQVLRRPQPRGTSGNCI
jgi:hypothetical protein